MASKDTVINRYRSIDETDTLRAGANNLRKSYIECETDNPRFLVDYIQGRLKEFTFLVCGGPRVGKSTLINAIIGRELAETGAGLSPITQTSKCYELTRRFPEILDQETNERINDAELFQTNIWDTKGITTWDQSIVDIVKEKNPMCVIFCASPGSFADSKFIRELIKECVNFEIFIALVCTNQWKGSDEQRQAVMQKFHELLESYTKDISEKNGVRHYGNIGLVTMVNSVDYVNKQLGVHKQSSGIGRLLFGIMSELHPDKLLGWCYTLLENDGFWSQMQPDIENFFAREFNYHKSILWSLSRGKTWFPN